MKKKPVFEVYIVGFFIIMFVSCLSPLHDVLPTYEEASQSVMKTELSARFIRVDMRYGRVKKGYPIAGEGDERWESGYSRLINYRDIFFKELPKGVDIALYDDDFNYCGMVSSIDSIPDGTAVVRLVCDINQQTGTSILCSYQGVGNMSFINEPNVVNPLWFTCDIDTTFTDNALERNYTNAVVWLPSSYSVEGAPVKLIVLCTGTTGITWNSVNNTYTNRISFFKNMGYAVLLVNPCSEKYKNSVRTNAATPLGVKCFESAIHYVLDNYNIEDGIYLYGKSAGGISSMNIINCSDIYVKAVALHAPNLDFMNDFRCSPTTVSTYYFQQIGMPVPPIWNYESVSMLKEKAIQLESYNPILFQNSIDKASYYDILIENDYPLASSYYPNNKMTVYSDSVLMGEEMQTLVEHAQLELKLPLKIWYAEDDEQVPYGTIENFAKMARNAGYECILRKMEDGTGGHVSMDCYPGHKDYEMCKKETVVTKEGDSMDVALGLVEVIQWFEIQTILTGINYVKL